MQEIENEKYTSIYEDEYTRNPDLIKEYNEVEDVVIEKNYEYIYLKCKRKK